MIETLYGCHMRAVLFLDMAKGGWMQCHQCVEHPLLTRTISRHTRNDPIITTWMVDGEAVADLEAARIALNRLLHGGEPCP